MKIHRDEVRRLAAAVTGRTVCEDCADVLVELLDAVRAGRVAAAVAADTEEADPPG